MVRKVGKSGTQTSPCPWTILHDIPLKASNLTADNTAQATTLSSPAVLNLAEHSYRYLKTKT